MRMNNSDSFHRDFIIGTFVIGTLAFIVAHAWNGFVEQCLEVLERRDEESGKIKNPLFYTGMYVLIVSVFSVIVVYVLLKLEIVQHKSHQGIH